MRIYYQFGIIIGLVLLAFAIHIAMKQHKRTLLVELRGTGHAASVLLLLTVFSCLISPYV